jgi:hypothetical protein
VEAAPRDDVPKVKELTAAVEQFEARVDDALVEAARPVAQEGSQKKTDSSPQRKKATAKVISIRRGRTSKQDLLDGAGEIDKL